MNAPAVSVQEVVESIVESHRDSVGALLPVLHDIQDRLGYVPEESLPWVAGALNLSRAEVHGVMSFYHDFRNSPAGRHKIQVCRAEACQSMGARELEQHAIKRLGIGFGETTGDGKITLEAVYCLGNCACAPSLRIGDQLHARVDSAAFDRLLDSLEEQG
jgi:formate dehydrogenase subunit gamma